MEFDRKLHAVLVAIYVCIALTYAWPYLSQAWQAHREGRPVRDVPRPAANRLITGSLFFLTAVLWTWLSFRD